MTCETNSRSEAPTTALTQASTQVATNRALDLALQRIERMQSKLQHEHERLDALVVGEAVKTAAKQKQKRQHQSLLHRLGQEQDYLDAEGAGNSGDTIQVQEVNDPRSRSVVQEAERWRQSPPETQTETIELTTPSRLGHHVRKMSAIFSLADSILSQSQSCSSSVKAEIDQNLPSVDPETVLNRFQHTRPGSELFIDDAGRKQLLLPSLTSPAAAEVIDAREFSSQGNQLLPPTVKQGVPKIVDSQDSETSPDPVFCVSPVTSQESMTMEPQINTSCRGSDIKPGPQRFELHENQYHSLGTLKEDARTPAHDHAVGLTIMPSPDSIFAGTFDNSLQSSVPASDRATFMQEMSLCMTPASYQKSSITHRTGRSSPQLESPSQSKQSRGTGLKEVKDRPPSCILKSAKNDAPLSSEKESLRPGGRLHAHINEHSRRNSDRIKIDRQCIDVQSARSRFESSQASMGTAKPDHHHDDASVKSLKGLFEKQVQKKPSIVTLMREKFETKRVRNDVSQHYRDTALKFRKITTQPQRHRLRSPIAIMEPVHQVETKELDTDENSFNVKDEETIPVISIRERIKAFENKRFAVQDHNLDNVSSRNAPGGQARASDPLKKSRRYDASSANGKDEPQASQCTSVTEFNVSLQSKTPVKVEIEKQEEPQMVKDHVSLVSLSNTNPCQREIEEISVHSLADSSDGVTLDASIADVSNITLPSAIISKAGENRSFLQHNSSDSSDDTSARDDISSVQPSEAAIPLLAKRSRVELFSDEFSESTVSFFDRRANLARSWPVVEQACSTKVMPTEMNETLPLTSDVDWDVSRVRSVFPALSTESLQSHCNVCADEFLMSPGTESGVRSGSSRFSNLDEESVVPTQNPRATTPTRSNKSIRLVPTNRSYTSCTIGSENLEINDAESREETEGKCRAPTIPSSARKVTLNGIAPAGFPLSSALREQAVRTSLRRTKQTQETVTDDGRYASDTIKDGYTKIRQEHARMQSRLQRLRNSRLKRSAISYQHESTTALSRKTSQLSNCQSDDWSGTNDSSTKYGGKAFLASLDLD